MTSGQSHRSRGWVARAVWVAGLAVITCCHSRAGADQPVGNKQGPSCGVACVASIFELATGKQLAPEQASASKDNGRSTGELSMLDLRNQAKELGLDLTGVKCTIEELRGYDVPAIVQTGGNHFLVVERISDSYVRLFDGPFTPVIRAREDFDKAFSGLALVPTEAVKASGREPRVTVDSSIVDIGEVSVGADVTRSFALRTEGAVPVRVLETDVCCGTTVEPAGTWDMAPGGENTVKLICRVAGGSPLFARSVSLKTDLPKWPMVFLTIAGRPLEPLLPVPQILSLGKIAKGSRMERTVRVLNVLPDQEQTARLSCSAPCLRAERTSYDAETRVLTLAVTLDTTDLRGQVREKVTVHLGSGNHVAEFAIPLTADVVGEISVSPADLFFGLVKKGTISVAKVNLVRKGKRAFTIVDMKSPSGVAAQWRKTDDGFVIEASVGPELTFDVLDDVVIISTDVPEDRLVKIPIYAALEPG